jgi:hypothetical protein
LRVCAAHDQAATTERRKLSQWNMVDDGAHGQDDR